MKELFAQKMNKIFGILFVLYFVFIGLCVKEQYSKLKNQALLIEKHKLDPYYKPKI